MDPNDLFLTAIRATIVYFFVLVVVRLLGKREIGSLTAFDLIVALMIGEVVDEAIFGDVTLLKGFVAIGAVAVWHLVNAWASYKSTFIDRLTGAEPTVLVEHGQTRQEALAGERMNEEELWTQLRLNGIERLEDVEEANWEPSGSMSVLQRQQVRPVQKQDLSRLQELFR